MIRRRSNFVCASVAGGVAIYVQEALSDLEWTRAQPDAGEDEISETRLRCLDFARQPHFESQHYGGRIFARRTVMRLRILVKQQKYSQKFDGISSRISTRLESDD